ncbi:uncharacterized protein LOC129939399 [Eupeodes corollae]|uniref:uncharacterized protein LOC129939399 n=1 Tax=Eupeodes corollae TaxID=290404 RepID=UPI0024929E66|nr:uncharacterized protein LOC129939399 [Eupeodes corollae]
MIDPNVRNRESIAEFSNQSLRSMIQVLSTGLKVCHINAQSLSPKLDEIRYLFINSKIDVVCVSETWFSVDSVCCVEGYNVFRCNRTGRVGGGVAIFTRNELHCKLIRKSQAGSDLEYVFVEIRCNNNKIMLGSVFCPHRNIDISPLFSVLDELLYVSPSVIVAGDFNNNVLKSSELTHRMAPLGLFPVNTLTPTHFTKDNSTLLDLFFVSHLSKVLLYDQLPASGFSRHDLIYLTFECRPIYQPSYYSFRDFKNVDRRQLEIDLNNIEWFRIYGILSVDDQISFLQTNINYLYDLHVPLTIKQFRRKNQSWFNNNIKALIRERNIAYKRWKLFRLDELYHAYKVLRNRVISDIREAKKRFYAPKLDPSLAKNELWKNLKDIGVGKQVNEKSVNCDELNKKFTSGTIEGLENSSNVSHLTDYPLNELPSRFYFSAVDEADVLESILAIKSNSVSIDGIHPVFLKAILPYVLKYITHTINTIFMSGTFPSVWKQTKVIPIPKNRDCDDFRPIAILPFLSKAVEKLINMY